MNSLSTVQTDRNECPHPLISFYYYLVANLIMIHVPTLYIICSNGRELGRRKREPFYVTFVVQNHQLKPLTTGRFEKPYPFGFIRVLSKLYRKKNSTVTLTVFHVVDKATRKLQTHRHTHILRLLFKICNQIFKFFV